jgi:hypothetical protein
MTLKRIGTAVLALAAITAMTALAPITASASLPMFSHWPLSFRLTSGVSTVQESAGQGFVCNSDLGHGNVTGLQTFLALVIFHGCVGHHGTSSCPINSPGQPPGLIHLHVNGELGTIKAGTGAGNIGAIIEPALSKSVFVTLLGECLEPKEFGIEGNFAGELSPVNTPTTTATLTIFANGAKSGITEFVVLHKVIKPKLTSFGLFETSISGTETLTFDGPIEIT